MRTRRRNESGQSIAEVVIGLAIGAILIVGAVTAISASLRADQEETSFQTGSFLARELLNNVSIVGQSNWRTLHDLAKSPTQFHLINSGGSFATSSDSEIITIDNESFTRFFTLENVSRTSGGNIEDVYNAANDDPSTQKVIVTVTWPAADGDAQSFTLEKFVTRRASLVFVQTDWSDGSLQPTEVVALPNNSYIRFASSTAIATSTGSISISGL